ncbi:MAG TPA: hypothetical protein VH598_01625, partial [Verrucomicrobiae bacterium]|nr:hypothetical protein [Verrucomicrobiae bacterium]
WKIAMAVAAGIVLLVVSIPLILFLSYQAVPGFFKTRDTKWQFNGTNIAGTTNSSPTPSNEALRLKLEFAEQEFKRVEQRRNVGLVSTEEYLNAKAARDIAAAEMKGDAKEVARVKLELAEAELEVIEKRRDVGAASESEYEQAKLARDLAALELKKIGEGK